MSLADLLFPENAALSWLPPPSIEGQFVSFLKALLPCLDRGAPGHLEEGWSTTLQNRMHLSQRKLQTD